MSIVGRSSQNPRFSPDCLPDLRLWLDAADPATLTLSGSNVTQWRDKSGLGNHASGGVSPTFSNAGILFNGSSTYLSTPYTAVPTVETILCVATWTGSAIRNYCIIGTSVTLGRNFNVLKLEASTSIRWDRWAVSGYAPTTGVQSNVPFLAIGVFTGSSGQTALNGGSLSSPESFSFSGTGSTNIGTGVLGDYFAGTINEIIVFSNALSTDQRQLVEGYLARKWGISALAGHPYRLGGPGILPTSIPGCSLWLDATDSTTLFQDTAGTSPVTSNGQTLRRWNDKSGRGCNATQAGNAPVWNSAGYATFAHTSAQNLRLPDGTLPTSAGTNAYSMFAVARPTVSGRNLTILCSGSSGTGLFNGLQIAGDGRLMNLWFNSDVGGGSVPLNTFSIMNANYTGATRTVFLTGSNVNTTNSTGWGGTISNNVIGMESATNNWAFTGDIAELIVYPTALSTTDHQRIEGYLATKWGINSRLPAPTAIGPYAGAILPMRPFSPLDIDGMVQWMDAADFSTLTFTGSNVTRWADKSGNDNHLLQNGSSNVPTYGASLVASRPALDFTGGAGLRTAGGVLNSSNVTLFVVAMMKPTTAFWGTVWGHFEVNRHDYDIQLRRTEASSNINWHTNNDNSVVQLQVGPDLPVMFSCTMRNGTDMAMQRVLPTQTNTVAASVGSTIVIQSVPIWVGRSGYNESINGYISEILYYSNVLTTPQQRQVETYLAEKWGFRGVMGGPTHPFRFAPAVVLPTQISGCTLWLDAADATTFTLSGSNVTQWRDKSGNGRNFTRAGAADRLTRITVDGNPVVYFNSDGVFGGSSNAWMTGIVPFSSSVTVLKVFTPIVFSPYNNIFWSWAWNADQDRVPGVRGWNGTPDIQPYVTYFGHNNNRIALTYGTPYVSFVEFTGGGANTRYSINGSTSVSSGTIASNTITPSTFFLGGDGPPSGATIQGRFYLSEFIVFSNTLTDLQRQQVEGYLAWKWGLQANLPGSTALFTNVKRALTPVFAPTQIEGCALWLDAADPTTLTLSGSNVTAWADKSGNGASVSQGTTSNQPTVSSNGLVFSGNQWFPTSITSAPTVESLFVVLTVASNATYDIFAGTQSGFRELLLYDGAFRVGKWGTTPSGLNSGAVPIGSRMMIAYQYTQSTTTLSLTGTTTSGSTPYTYTGSGTSWIGAASYAPNNFVGTINEIVYYNRTVTNSERRRIEGYLAHKWGLLGNLGGGHPFIYGPPSVLPTQFTGCTLWLDATDSTSFTLSGSNVTQWRDKSSNAYAGTASGNPVRTTVDGYSAVTFDGTQYINFGDVADLGAAPLNIFVVSKFNTTDSGTLIAKTYYGEAASRYALLREGGSMRLLLQTSAGQNVPTVADTNTSRRILTWTWDRTAQTLYQNGTSILTTAFSNTDTFNSTFSLLVGAYPSSGTGGPPPVSGFSLNGSINEIVCIFGTLTTVQRQQIEGYLAWKWGLQQSLPSSAHPYKTFKP